MNWLNEYPNIFRCQWIDQTNIPIYLGTGKATNMNTNSIWRPFFVVNTFLCVSSLKQVKTYQHLSQIVQIGQENIFVCPRIDRMNIQFYLRSSRNDQTKNRIYSDWGKTTNMNIFCEPFYLNIWTFKYSCSSLSHRPAATSRSVSTASLWRDRQSVSRPQTCNNSKNTR